MCDEENCDRAVCNACIKIPTKELGRIKDNASISFRCISCHWGLTVKKNKDEGDESDDVEDPGDVKDPSPYYVSICSCRPPPRLDMLH